SLLTWQPQREPDTYRDRTGELRFDSKRRPRTYRPDRPSGTGLRRGAVPDLDYVGAEMQKAADRVLGRKGAKVLLGSAMVN
ncbi:hypothetical protein AB4142_29180, partial [Variovorax sp. 2RAF20]